MLKKRLIPCILLKNGRCVKGVNFGDFRDTGNPVTTARVYDSQGADELIFLDITATLEKRGPACETIRSAADQCFMPLTAGGGVKNVEDFRELLLAGADKVSINTAAIENPKLISEAAKIFGAQCVVVSIDVKKINGKQEVLSHSGTRSTGLEPVKWAKTAEKLGAGEILITSIDREGKREGYDIGLTRTVADAVNIPVIASGGAGTVQDFVKGIKDGHASAVSAGSIFHFTDQSIIKAKAHMKNEGIDVRAFKWWG